MATITPKVAVLGGVDPLAYAAASVGGDLFAAQPGNRYLIHVKNGDTTSKTLTIDDPTSVGPPSFTTFVPDVAVIVPNAGERVVLVNDAARFIDSNGDINLSWSAITSVTFQVFRI